MKNLILLLFIPLVFACSNMESDAEKVCDLSTQTIEMIPEMAQLGMKAGFGDDESKKEAQKQLDEIEADIEKIGSEIENIRAKYDEDEFQTYLLENCEGFKELIEIGEGLQGLGDLIDDN